MITRKKRRMIIILICILIIAIMSGTFAFLYINTDLFKSNNKLFAKYFAQNFDVIKELEIQDVINQKIDTIKGEKYESNIVAQIEHIKNPNTSEENTDNTLNKVKLNIDEQVDKNNKFDYKEIYLTKQKEDIFKLEYLSNDNYYGIRANGVKQFIAVRNSDLKQIAQKLGIQEDIINKIPDSIEQIDLKEVISLSKEELDILKSKYLDIIIKNVSTDNFKKQSGGIITINQKETSVNSYTITLTKEQLNNIYIDILEQIKQDDIILSKISKLQHLIILNNSTDIKDNFIEYINNVIKNIKDNNIGQDEVNITVYENKGQTVRTSIEHATEKVTFDIIKEDKSISLNIDYNIFSADHENSFNLEVTKQTSENQSNTHVEFYSINDDDRVNTKLDSNINVEKGYLNHILFEYNDNKDKINIELQNNKQNVEQLDIIEHIDEDNIIKLEELEDAQAKNIFNIVKNKINNQLKELSNTINIEDFNKILEILKLKEENPTIENSIGITETEKNRFNLIFSFYEGDKVNSDDVIQLLDKVKNNTSKVEIISDQNIESNIIIERDNKSNEGLEFLEQLIKDEKNSKIEYQVKMNYDDIGLIQSINIKANKNK